MISAKQPPLEALSALLETSRTLERYIAEQQWEELAVLTPEIEHLCDQLHTVTLSKQPELLQIAQDFVALEQKLRPLLGQRLHDIRQELASQQNKSQLNNTYNF